MVFIVKYTTYLVRFPFLSCKRYNRLIFIYFKVISYMSNIHQLTSIAFVHYLSSPPHKTSHYHWRRHYPLGHSLICCWCYYRWLFYRRGKNTTRHDTHTQTHNWLTHSFIINTSYFLISATFVLISKIVFYFVTCKEKEHKFTYDREGDHTSSTWIPSMCII